jgi:hypothetical protein
MYQGMRPSDDMKRAHAATVDYLRQARADGIRLAFGYICATSIVNLPQFDRHWPAEFRSKFSSAPADWLQQDRDGRPLASWYGGDYRPACMNHPDWRRYQKSVVHLQLDAGFDGIFFDNPTVHPQGCYCPHCMRKFAAFLAKDKSTTPAAAADLPPADAAPNRWRKVALERPEDFLRFRATIAADFLAEMRDYARTIKPHALVTCNNSLNSPDVLYRQCRTYGYDIHELSKIENLVVVEDMGSQPRTLPDGRVVEYGPVYEVVAAISHGKPVVAVTIADGDYHTPPNLMRLAMAEAAAHGASYLSWPTWPQDVRQRMIESVRPQANVLRENASLLGATSQRADVILFMPFREWSRTADCRPMRMAQQLGAANVQFAVACEDDLAGALAEHPGSVLVVESASVLQPAEETAVQRFEACGGQVLHANEDAKWLARLGRMMPQPSVRIRQGPPALRAIVRDQPSNGRTIVHLLNLGVRRISSYEDQVTAAKNVMLEVSVPFAAVGSVEAISADAVATHGPVIFTAAPDGRGTLVKMEVEQVAIASMLVIRAQRR